MGMIGTETKGKRRGVDSEINLIPMIDLLVVTIAFLLLTQCLTTMGRMDASAQVPGPSDGCGEGEKSRKLVVDARREDKFVLTWKQGNDVLHTTEVEKSAVTRTDGKIRHVSYPELAKALGEEWKTFGLHKAAGDRRVDPLVLRTSNDLPYASLVGMLDASSSVTRPGGPGSVAPSGAFDVTFGVD